MPWAFHLCFQVVSVLSRVFTWYPCPIWHACSFLYLQIQFPFWDTQVHFGIRVSTFSSLPALTLRMSAGSSTSPPSGSNLWSQINSIGFVYSCWISYPPWNLGQLVWSSLCPANLCFHVISGKLDLFIILACWRLASAFSLPPSFLRSFHLFALIFSFSNWPVSDLSFSEEHQPKFCPRSQRCQVACQ